jgi:hypothetical protein
MGHRFQACGRGEGFRAQPVPHGSSEDGQSRNSRPRSNDVVVTRPAACSIVSTLSARPDLAAAEERFQAHPGARPVQPKVTAISDYRKGYSAKRLNSARLKAQVVLTATITSALPVTHVVDTNGILRAKFTPDDKPLTEKSLTDSVLPLLAEQSAAHTESQAS